MLELFVFDELDSTQKFLVDYLRCNPQAKAPLCILADRQSRGIGSRNNMWEGVENGLTFSFVIKQDVLPQDLPLQSFSLYLAILLQEYLKENGYLVWVKWPNDLYIQDQKVGGVMSQCIKDNIVAGVGINLFSSNFGSLQVVCDKETKRVFVENFLEFLMTFPMWKEIFSKYKLEFYKNFDFSFHNGDEVIAFQDVKLCDDGSILCGDQRFYSLR